MTASTLVSVATFPSAADAEIAKGVLEAAGIDAMIRHDDAGGMYPAIGCAEILVRSEDRQRAHEALDEPPAPRRD